MQSIRSWFPVLLGISLLVQPLRTAGHPVSAVQDTETKEQRDARMQWWREARFGMFIHWGLYSLLAGEWQGKKTPSSNGEWIMNDLQIPVADYRELARQFNPVKFDADAWVSLAKAAGMKYIVITAKHHDGFAMFRSKANSFNVADATPFKRDPLKELAAACQRQGIKLGFYYSQDQDWTAPGASALNRAHWDKAQDGDFATYLHDKSIPQIRELLANYQPYPAVIWFDTSTKNMTPQLAAEIVALLNQHPNLIWNNRLGGSYPGDTETPEQHIPAQGFPGKDWETCMTLNGTWGYKKNDLNFKSTETLLRNLIDIASKGGNYLLNVGPDAQGLIPQAEADRLLEIGKWLNVNGEAIYATSPSPFQRQLSWGRATQKPGKLFLHVFDWPKDGNLPVPMGNKIDKAYLLAQPQAQLKVKKNGSDGMIISLPATAPDPLASVVVLEFSGPVAALPQPLVQEAGGKLVLAAGDSIVVGKTLRVENPGNLGYWTDVNDCATWTVRINKPGLFKVVLEYATVSDATLTLGVGEQKLEIQPAKTGGWKNYQTIEAGTIKIAKAGDYTVRLGGSFKSGGAVANVKKLVLSPAGS
jgi:alpha-L-fucosidase